MQLNTITEILQIPGYKVTHVVSNRKRKIEFLLERKGERASVCSGCGKVHHTAVHSEGVVVVEDLPISGKRFILMQNKVTNKQKDVLDELSRLNERVYKSMLLKEQFLSLYDAGNRKVAYANLKVWIGAAIRSGIPSFVELGYKFFRKRHYVLNYFVCKITSAISEGINSKIKRLKRMSYGYRDVLYTNRMPFCAKCHYSFF